MASIKHWHKSGSPYIWITAGAISASLIMVLGLLALIAVRGLGQFWPGDVVEVVATEPGSEKETIVGELVEKDEAPAKLLRDLGYQLPEDVYFAERFLYKLGNRDFFGTDFRWVPAPALADRRYPPELMAVERHEWGNLYGYLIGLKENGKTLVSRQELWPQLQERLRRKRDLFGQIRELEKKRIGAVNYALEDLRLQERKRELAGSADSNSLQHIDLKRKKLQSRYDNLNKELQGLYQQIGRDTMLVRISDGREVEVPLSKVVRAYRPNEMGLVAKAGFYASKLWEFLSDEPREANTEGGIFPAIFGTVMMVLIMTVLVTPFGVIAAIYLREYAKQGPLIRLIRIAVNNLAGVPSVVYGVFGLGFFVYTVGAQIDRWFFPEALPGPTFGTPGLLWSSLTLALLTVPVVIVATEEGLARVPRAIREGSLALGATKAETLWRTVLPMATPAMITGLILAIARAAGEVAPLMMVGVVKLAPSLPLDANFPFLHLDRKFMHLGFHIFDVGFQSPNIEAARPLVYATTLLLVAIIVVLNLTAIRIRNRLREKYKAAE